MIDLFTEIKELSPIEIMEKLEEVTDADEDRFYVGLLNFQAELTFKRLRDG